MNLITSAIKPILSIDLQRQLGHKHYELVWFIMQKLRKAIGLREQEYKLDKIVELDEGFFESIDTPTPLEDKPIELKRGRDSKKQSEVIVMDSTVHTLKNQRKT